MAQKEGLDSKEWRKEFWRLRVEAERVNWNIPDSFMEGLERYFVDRIRMGSFGNAVLENNLKEAVAHADIWSRACLQGIVGVCYNALPSVVWGSVGAVNDWLNGEDVSAEEVDQATRSVS